LHRFSVLWGFHYADLTPGFYKMIWFWAGHVITSLSFVYWTCLVRQKLEISNGSIQLLAWVDCFAAAHTTHHRLVHI
jgi:hypothetical protein